MKTIIEAEGILIPSCSKSHIAYCFHLDRKMERLNIDFSYEPKQLLDRETARKYICEGIQRFAAEKAEQELERWEAYYPIQNLLTVSLDDAKGFRGCAHRQTPVQHHFLSETEASHGFIPGKLEQGMWKVTINLHAVYTEDCRYHLRVWEGKSHAELDTL